MVCGNYHLAMFCQIQQSSIRLVSVLITFLLQHLISIIFRGSVAGHFGIAHLADSDGGHHLVK